MLLFHALSPSSDGTSVWYVLDELVLERSEASALSTSSSRHAHHPLVQTFPVRSVMHGRYEDITKVDFTLTEPSQLIGVRVRGGWRTMACTSAQAPSRRGKLRCTFADHPTAPYVSKVKSVRFLNPEVDVLRAIVGMILPAQPDLDPNLNTIQTLIASKLDGQWRIVLFQNTPAQFHGRPDLV